MGGMHHELQNIFLCGYTSILASRSIDSPLMNLIRGQSPDVAGWPILDKPGFTGHFDVDGLEFAGLVPTQIGGSDSDAPAIQSSLEKKLALKPVSIKARFEVLVIDSIDRPTEN